MQLAKYRLHSPDKKKKRYQSLFQLVQVNATQF